MSDSPSPEAVAHDDLCPICHLLLYKPVKTECNHVLCASCMAQWASVSSMSVTDITTTPTIIDGDLTRFDLNDPVADIAALAASCPMCRTQTSATPHTELGKQLEEKYPATYAGRRTEEEAQGEAEGITILIGNRHRLERNAGESANRHDWRFFVRFSRPEIIEQVSIYLHPTFRPSRIVLWEPPFEVRRLGWGIFNIETTIRLKEPYVWVQQGSDIQRHSMVLDWMLSFDGRGKQGGVRAKVKRLSEEEGAVVHSRLNEGD